MAKRVRFVTNSQNYNRGSYRIWIHDLHNYFKQLYIPSNISNEVGEEEIIIVGKGETDLARNIKQTYPDKKVGLINPVVGKYDFCDFLIVGSIEEQISLSQNKNVFLFPLIEDLFQNVDVKEHTETDVIRFCFHGHYPHLAKFDPYVCEALEKFSKQTNIELVIIHGNPEFNWKVGKPNIPIKFIQWDATTIVKDILSTDIGLSPNITHVTNYSRNQIIDTGVYDTDYIIRFKNKSNAGRSFVYHQLGIPVVTDLTPSNLHILGDPDNGFIAGNTESWLNAFQQLSSCKVRRVISRNAKIEFDRLYNPLLWARKLYNNLKNL